VARRTKPRWGYRYFDFDADDMGRREDNVDLERVKELCGGEGNVLDDPAYPMRWDLTDLLLNFYRDTFEAPGPSPEDRAIAFGIL